LYAHALRQVRACAGEAGRTHVHAPHHIAPFTHPPPSPLHPPPSTPQGRYGITLSAAIVHLSFECQRFSDTVAELLFEELTQCSAENTAHLFVIMEDFLSLQDSLTAHRAQQIFRAEMGPLAMLQGIRDQATKARLVCVCVRSLMALMARVPSVKRLLTQSDTQIRQWAPWMLKFCTQFWMKCEKEAQDAAELRAATAAGSDTAATAPLSTAAATSAAATGTCIVEQIVDVDGQRKRPWRAPPVYLVVYGDDESQCEDPWVARAERALALLREMLESVGAQPDVLTPDDTWGGGGSGLDSGSSGGGNGEGTVAMGPAGTASNPMRVDDEDMPELISASAAMGPVRHDVPMDVDVDTLGLGVHPMGVGLKDGMTDEEIERYLAVMAGEIEYVD
jgi:hypothetical protein